MSLQNAGRDYFYHVGDWNKNKSQTFNNITKEGYETLKKRLGPNAKIGTLNQYRKAVSERNKISNRNNIKNGSIIDLPDVAMLDNTGKIAYSFPTDKKSSDTTSVLANKGKQKMASKEAPTKGNAQTDPFNFMKETQEAKKLKEKLTQPKQAKDPEWLTYSTEGRTKKEADNIKGATLALVRTFMKYPEKLSKEWFSKNMGPSNEYTEVYQPASKAIKTEKDLINFLKGRPKATQQNFLRNLWDKSLSKSGNYAEAKTKLIQEVGTKYGIDQDIINAAIGNVKQAGY